MSSDHTERRWRQRHDNLRKAVILLAEAVEERRKRPLSELEKAGFVQRFEIAWELAWKLQADYLRAAGRELEIVGPKPVIRAAYEAGVIEDGQAWIDATDLRNLLSHIYDSKQAEQALDAIADRYLSLMTALVAKLGNDDVDPAV